MIFNIFLNFVFFIAGGYIGYRASLPSRKVLKGIKEDLERIVNDIKSSDTKKEIKPLFSKDEIKNIRESQDYFKELNEK